MRILMMMMMKSLRKWNHLTAIILIFIKEKKRKIMLVGLSEVHLQLHTTWRSGPEDKFCLAVRKSHLLLLSPPIKTQHTRKGKWSVNVEACMRVFRCVCICV